MKIIGAQEVLPRELTGVIMAGNISHDVRTSASANPQRASGIDPSR